VPLAWRVSRLSFSQSSIILKSFAQNSLLLLNILQPLILIACYMRHICFAGIVRTGLFFTSESMLMVEKKKITATMILKNSSFH